MPEDGAGRDFLRDKDIFRITRDALDKGRTKQEVYDELSRRCDSKEYLAQIMSRVPEVETRAKCRAANKALGVLMNVACSLNLVLPLLCLIKGRDYRLRVLDPIVALMFFVLTFDVYRMNNDRIYAAIGVLSFMGILGATRLFQDQVLWGLANIFLFATIGGLSLHIGGRLRSDWAPAAPAEDDRKPGTQQT